MKYNIITQFNRLVQVQNIIKVYMENVIMFNIGLKFKLQITPVFLKR